MQTMRVRKRINSILWGESNESEATSRYSPNLVPSELSLFDYAKGCLIGFSFEGTGQLLQAVPGA
jgi:hypothetical protein